MELYVLLNEKVTSVFGFHLTRIPLERQEQDITYGCDLTQNVRLRLRAVREPLRDSKVAGEHDPHLVRPVEHLLRLKRPVEIACKVK